jgi:acetolactate synthase-1/2/3 large subunit
VRYSGAKAQLVSLAEELSVPVASSLSGKDVIPADHPLAVGVTGLYSREAANRLVAECDLVFFIGTKTGSLMTHSWRIPPQDVKVIQCDISPDVLGLNYRNDASLAGDARTSLELVLEAAREVGERADRSAWLERVRSVAAAWYAEHDGQRNSDAVPMRPERLCKEIPDALPPNGVLVVDTGHAGMWSAGYVDLTSSDQVFLRSAGTLGWAFPGSIGAQLALPDRPVVCLTGDGGISCHLAELETLARWDIPATIVVNNNSAYNQGIGLWTDAYEGELSGRHSEMWTFKDLDFAAIAREIGLDAVRVEQPAELAGALQTAIASDGPYLVDVVTDVWARAPKAWLPV